MNLRKLVISGGLYLLKRQVLGMALNLGGILYLNHLIGPENYGLYAAASGIYNYWQSLGKMGLGTYLVRLEGTAGLERFHLCWSALVLLSLLSMVLAFLMLPIVNGWVHLDHFRGISTVLYGALPLGILVIVPLSLLERNLDFQKVASLELLGLFTFYGVAIGLALAGWGFWSPVVGWWAQQMVMLIGALLVSTYVPRWFWNKAQALEALHYGFGYAASLWVIQLRDLVNPLIVGRLAGAEAVGYIALAIRMATGLSFVKSIAWRISIAAMGKIQNQPAQLLRSINEGMRLQVLALGPLLVGFVWFGEWFLERVGVDWSKVELVFPFIALGILVNSIFNLHASALYVLRKNWEVTVYHAVHVLLFATASFLLVSRMGWLGYGWAEVVALLSYGVIHAFAVQSLGPIDYRLVFLCAGAFALALFWDPLGWISISGLLGLAIWPQTWKMLASYWQMVKGLRNGL